MLGAYFEPLSKSPAGPAGQAIDCFDKAARVDTLLFFFSKGIA